MKTKYIVVSIIILVLILIAIPATTYLGTYYAYYQDNKKSVDKTRTYSPTQDLKTITINEIIVKKPIGRFNVEGYVIKKYICQPCPPFAMCERCRPFDSVVISEENSDKIIKGKTLDIEVTNPNQFEIGYKYKFSIEIKDTENIPKGYPPEIKLLGYSRIGPTYPF